MCVHVSTSQCKEGVSASLQCNGGADTGVCTHVYVYEATEGLVVMTSQEGVMSVST